MLTPAILALASLSLATDAAPEAGRAMQPAECEALTHVELRDVRIELATHIEAGAYLAPDGARHAVPAFCRVKGEARPSADSHVGFEVWMPAGGWTGRYYQLGNGGFAGWIHFPSLAAELRRLNAVALTDTGHQASGVDASWARGHPERIVDFGYRSLDATSDAARALVRAYYERPAKRHYFVGCSNGGRQGLKLAQRYPEDWDGILVGAPANDWTRQIAGWAWLQQWLRGDPARLVPATKLPAIERAARASCDSADDPRRCPFEAAALRCPDEERDDCLTADEVESVARIHDGRRAGAADPTFFGFEATSAAAGEWASAILGSDPAAGTQLGLAEQFFRHMVFERPDWTVSALHAERDLAYARARQVAGQPLSRVLDAMDEDYSRFAARDSRIIMYFGWGDGLFSPRAGIEYYERVASAAGGMQRAQRFFRLFMVPGMGHCQGGPAPNAFGQAGIVPALYDDAIHDARRALERWVEQGIAPERLVAVKFVEDDPHRGVAATRALCPYPNTGEC